MSKHPSYGIGLGRAPVRIAGLYAATGLLWIWLSDSALIWLGFNENQWFLAGAVKGTAFVTATAVLLYWLVRREVRAVQRSEGLLRAVVEGTTDAVFVKDREGRYLLFNEAAATFVGKPVASVLGQDDTALFDPSDAKRLMERDRRIMAEGEVVTLDETITSGGTTRTYEATKAPFRDSRGVVVGVIGVSRDVTQRKATEDALRVSEERYRELANAIPQIVWTAGPDGGLTDVNRKAEEYTGLAAAELIGWSWGRVIHADDLAASVAEWKRALGDGVPRSFEMRICRVDGEYRWHVVRQFPIRDVHGAIQSWVGTCTDIDDSKMAENALRETKTRLREAQRIARLGSWTWEPETDRVTWSDAEFELFGVDRQTVTPSFDAFLKMLHPDDRPIAVERVRRMRDGASEFANDMRIVRPDGSISWIHSRARATRDADGRIIRVEGTDQDITDRVHAEEALKESEQRLRLALEAAGAIAFTWDIQRDEVTRYFSNEPALPVTAERLGTLEDVRARVHVDDQRGFDERLKACLLDGVDYRNQYRIVRLDGTFTTLEEYGVLDRGTDGRPKLLTGISIDISDRIAATRALEISEERLRIALQGASGGVWDWDLLSGEVWWSPEVYDLMGASVGSDTRATAAIELILESDRQRVHEAIADAIERRGDYHCEFRVHNGTRWLSSRGRLFYDPNGRPVRLLGMSWDISDRMFAMEALRTSEARYRQLVDLLPTAIFVYANDSILYCNPAFMRMMGVNTEDELLGISPFDITHPTAHDAIRRRNEHLSNSGEAAPGFEKQIVRRDGRHVPVFSVAAPISGYGQPATVVAVTDLTERERPTQLLRSVLSSVGDAILTIDERAVIGSANPAALRQFGYTENELIGQKVSVLMPSPLRENYVDSLNHYLRTGEAKVIGIGREVECSRKDGTRFPAELTVTEFSLEGERHFTGVLRDITERQRLQSQVTQAQKMEAVGRLAGGVAHDFNNLLTIINGYSDLLLMSNLPTGDTVRESIAIVRDAGERAARLTQQLLAFSRKAVVEPKVIDLNELVSSSARLLRRLIGEDIILAVVTSPRPIHVKADPGLLEQVIMNLFVNARDAMPTGGRLTIETTTVATESSATSRFARLSVSDTGHGMPDDVKEKIFEPFFTTKGVGKGTGLGLAVVHGVVTQSGGQISIQSSVGGGTTFHILLPLNAESRLVEHSDSVRFASRGTETILLVEDEEAVRKITCLALQTQGYVVIEAEGGAQAIQLAENHPGEIHLMVSDVVMPEMGGRQLLDAVRQHRPGLRVLFMSGYTDDAILLHGVVESTDAFIQKPFTPLALARKVREVIDAPSK